MVDVPVGTTEDVVALARRQLAAELDRAPRGWRLNGNVTKHNGSNIFKAELINE